MKMMKKIASAVLPIAAVFAMTACSGGSDSSGGGGTGGGGSLATGGFVKSFTTTSVSGNTFPFNSYNPYQKVQHIYTASQIQGSGNLNKISFTYSGDEPAEVICQEMTIRMGHSSLSALTDTFANNVEEGKGSLQTVEDNVTLTLPAGSAGDKFDIVLSTPFIYNGVDNLVIEFEHTAACSESVAMIFDNTDPATRVFTNSVSATGNLGSILPHMDFTFAGGVDTQVYGAGLGHSYPFNSGSGHLQHLYTATDINGSGPITGYALQMTNMSSEGNYTMTVKMGHTSADALVDTYANNSADFKVVAADVVVNVPAGIAADDWVWIPLNGSFKYNGTDNIVVDIEVSASSGTTNQVNTVSVGGSTRVYGAAGTVTGSVDGYVNNAKFRFNGATMDVMSLGSKSGSGQVLGYDAGGGQIQSLYKNTDLGTSGKVTAVSVRLGNDAVAAAVSNHKIYLGHTAKSALSAADPYVDNMDNYVLAYSGTTNVPGTLKRGDWLKIPLTTPFNYDSSKNLTVLFIGETNATNSVLASVDATRFSTASVGRNDNSVDIDGQPDWDFNGIVDIKLELTK